MNKALAPPPGAVALPSCGRAVIDGRTWKWPAHWLRPVACRPSQRWNSRSRPDLRPEDQKITQLTRNVAKLADTEPEAVARLVRT